VLAWLPVNQLTVEAAVEPHTNNAEVAVHFGELFLPVRPKPELMDTSELSECTAHVKCWFRV
jgi:hypothetical protein